MGKCRDNLDLKKVTSVQEILTDVDLYVDDGSLRHSLYSCCYQLRWFLHSPNKLRGRFSLLRLRKILPRFVLGRVQQIAAWLHNSLGKERKADLQNTGVFSLSFFFFFFFGSKSTFSRGRQFSDSIPHSPTPHSPWRGIRDSLHQSFRLQSPPLWQARSSPSWALQRHLRRDHSL